MRILVVCQYYYPEQFLINDIAPELVSRGHKVTVLTGRPNYPQGKVYKGYEKGKHNRETKDGVEIIRCPIIPRGNGIVQLMLNYFSYMVLANKKAKQLDGAFDIVYLYQLTPILQAYPAIKYAQRNNVKVICYCLDLAPLSGSSVASHLRILHGLYKRFSRWAYQNCDQIAVTSKDFIDYLHEIHGIPLTKLSYLPQHASEMLLNADLKKENSDDIIDFMFAGNIGTGARLECLIYAIEKLRNRGLKCRMNIVGDGRSKVMLEELTKRLDLNEYVIFHGRVSMSDMKEIYKRADALVVSLRKGQITVPGKVQAYMATGKPIFGAMDGSGKKMIEEAGCGRCVDAEDVDGICNMLQEYIEHAEIFEECGERGRDYFRRNFLLNKHVDRLEQLFYTGNINNR